ncbi:CRISPR-associated exonuclease Cas4/endonuclease Cas1 fusion [Alicyclobacillus acidoterrestris]|uniref:CRISPR-associated endonuclease Cas4g/Cas1g n=1 Tax=Alicyclobacillus suci TaxID=2816080 RepID=UPI0011924BEA|nr:CRISPR-associated endonuclease Cas1 [Alicyclobacillus suci]GEO27312.1 CRISPR-associated exonuclease Cas4/endonuclease Cas1 fusion [Alicyclobacillus acidoterrestris]
MAVPIRMLNELSYCERLYHLMHVQGLFEKSADTVEGSGQHDRADRRKRPSDVGQDVWGFAPQSLHLGDEDLGIVGKLDAIRYQDDGYWEPVEAKHSSAPNGGTSFRLGEWELDGKAWPNDQIQLCAQGLLLRANGFPTVAGKLFYRGNRQTVRIVFSEELIAATVATIRRAHELEQASMPSPLLKSDKCFRCSLNGVCLPDETIRLTSPNGEAVPIRDIVPSRDDLGTVYVSEPGTRVGKRGYELTITSKDGMESTVPLKDVRHISLFGNVQISTQLVHDCMESGVTISYLTAAGRLVGMNHNLISKNVLVRREQFRRFGDERDRLTLARYIVRAKILNQRTLLRRNAHGLDKVILKDLLNHARRSEEATSIDSLLGIEGIAAKQYMQAFVLMLKVKGVPAGETLMNGRNRRPPKDPVNALLSLGYSLLERDMYAALAAVGLDPLMGFYHRIATGRPSLVLDMMEPFRAIIADSVVVRTLNTGEIAWDDFYIGQESCSLKLPGRKRFFQAFERRMHETVTHPVFGYKLSYRRMLELEARFLSRYLMGELPEYRPIVTR